MKVEIMLRKSKSWAESKLTVNTTSPPYITSCLLTSYNTVVSCKMTRTCIAINSQNRQTPNSNITFHYIPIDCERRKQWLVKIRRENYTVKNQDSLCSNHFEEKCFNCGAKYTTLKRSAVPSLFDFAAHLRQPPAKVRRILHRTVPEDVPYEEFTGTTT